MDANTGLDLIVFHSQHSFIYIYVVGFLQTPFAAIIPRDNVYILQVKTNESS